MFDAYTVNWLHLLARWAHIPTGAAWIGTSFYFIFLNNSIRPPDNDDGPAAKAVWMATAVRSIERPSTTARPTHCPPPSTGSSGKPT